MPYIKYKSATCLLGVATLMLFGCTSHSSGDSDKEGHTGGYAITSSNVDSTKSAYTKIPISVDEKNFKFGAAKESSTQKYTLTTTPNEQIIVDNQCVNIPLGQKCDLLVSSTNPETGTDDIQIKALINGVDKNITTTVQTKNQQLRVSRESSISLPTHQVVDFSLLNTSIKDTIFFDSPQFINDTKLAKTSNNSVTLSNNTCTNMLLPGQTCTFNLIADKAIHGAIKISKRLQPITTVNFNDQELEAIPLMSLPENTEAMSNYSVLYQLVNKSSIKFNNLHISDNANISDAFTIDPSSSCITQPTLEPAKSCLLSIHFKGLKMDSYYLDNISITYNKDDIFMFQLHTYTQKDFLKVNYLQSLPDNIFTDITYRFT